MVKFFREKVDDLGERFPVWIGISLEKFDPKRLPTALPQSRALGRLWQLNDRACVAYVPQPYPGTVTDFRPRQQYRRYSKPEAKWEPLAQGGQQIIVLPVYPAGMLVEPFVKHLAAALRNSIDSATASQQTS